MEQQFHPCTISDGAPVPVSEPGAGQNSHNERRLFDRPIINLAYSLDEKRRVSLEYIVDVMVKKMSEKGQSLTNGVPWRLEEKNLNRYRVHDFYKMFWYSPSGAPKPKLGFKIEFTLYKKIGEGMRHTAKVTIFTKWQKELQPLMDQFRKEAVKLDIDCTWSLRRPPQRQSLPPAINNIQT